MSKSPLPTVLTTVALAAVGAGAMTSAALAASPGQTVKVHDAHAYVDNKAPGIVVSGTIFKGDPFKIQRVVKVTHGSAKGTWYYGSAHVTGDHAKNSKGQVRPFDIKGWVKAEAFS